VVRRSPTEKLEIVRQSLVPGVSAAGVARAHGISLPMLYRWRKAYHEMIATDLAVSLLDASIGEAGQWQTMGRVDGLVPREELHLLQRRHRLVRLLRVIDMNLRVLHSRLRDTC
jgi:transposase-like protein